MKTPPPEQIVEKLSDDLQDLLVREAFVRQRREAWRAALTAKQAEVAGRAQTRPSFMLFRGKEAKESLEAAGGKMRDEILALERGVESCDVILKKCAKIIETGLAEAMGAFSAEFRNLQEARKFLPEWEESVEIYRSSLRHFITALGIARNQMSSGYNRKAGTFAQGALDAFDMAAAKAKTLETSAAGPNQLAKRYRQALGVDVSPQAVLPEHVVPPPYIDTHAVAQQVAAFKTVTLEVAATRIGALIDECESMHHDGVAALLGELERVQASHEAAHQRYVVAPLAEIRAMAEGMVDPAQADAVYAAMEARFVSLTG